MLRVGALLMAIACPALVHADIVDRGSQSRAPRVGVAMPVEDRDHAIYVEGLGKAGPYGVGYERTIAPRLAIGVAASYAVVRDQQLTTIAPYVHTDLLRSAYHSLYVDLGFVLVHSRLPSPVPEWDGMTSRGAGGQATLGWEWRPWSFLVRSSFGVAAGDGGMGPFLGMAFGARL